MTCTVTITNQHHGQLGPQDVELGHAAIEHPQEQVAHELVIPATGSWPSFTTKPSLISNSRSKSSIMNPDSFEHDSTTSTVAMAAICIKLQGELIYREATATLLIEGYAKDCTTGNQLVGTINSKKVAKQTPPDFGTNSCIWNFSRLFSEAYRCFAIDCSTRSAKTGVDMMTDTQAKSADVANGSIADNSVNGDDISKLRQEAAFSVVKRHSVLASGLSLIPSPLADCTALIGVQLNMINKLCQVYDVPFSRDAGLNIVVSLLSGCLPVSLKLGAASLMKGVPIVGNVASYLIMPGLSAAFTYGTGRAIIDHFDGGFDLLSLLESDKLRLLRERVAKEPRR